MVQCDIKATHQKHQFSSMDWLTKTRGRKSAKKCDVLFEWPPKEELTTENGIF